MNDDAVFRRVSESVIHEGYVWNLAVAEFEAPDGSTFRRDIVRSPGAVGVVPLVFDAEGNAYSVNTVGNTLYLRGFEKIGQRYWAQTNSRFGQMTFFTGIASDGEAWVGYTRRVGWTTINRFSSSGGSSAKFTCSRLTGC